MQTRRICPHAYVSVIVLPSLASIEILTRVHYYKPFGSRSDRLLTSIRAAKPKLLQSVYPRLVRCGLGRGVWEAASNASMT